MSKTKYAIILFLAMYISLCAEPLILEHISILTEKQLYAVLVPICCLLLWLSDLILNTVASLGGSDSWMTVYERQNIGYERLYGLDVIRTIAVVFVPAVHFLGLTTFYDTPMLGKKMFAAVAMRWLFICCVPLFLTLTGFLKCGKGVDGSHYKSILSVLMTHIFISGIRLYVDKKVLGVELTRQYIISKLVYFDYGWYIRLYIAIMLLVPFCNAAWNGLKGRAHKELLIVTLMLLTSVGPFTFGVIPHTWLILYVFMYYFMGAYLRDYDVYINKAVNLLFIVMMLFTAAIGSFFHPTASGCFDWDFAAYSANSGYSALPVAVLTFLIMTLFVNMECDFAVFRVCFYLISVVSLEMYMFSQMFDSLIYPKLQYNTFTDILPAITPIVGIVLALSFAAAHLKRLFFMALKIPLSIFNKD